MVWLLTKASHSSAISGWVRQWLKGSPTDRFIQVSLPGFLWAAVWGVIAFSGDADVLFFTIGLAPWYFWALDAVVDHFHTNSELGKLMSRDDIVLATRAEYVGGHPRLPHGRFAYLVLAGNRQNPSLTILYPGQENDETFEIPLLDISELSPKSEHEESLTQQVFEPLLAKLTERPGRLFHPERVTLNVGYKGQGGRVHMVELTSFYRGNDEVRNWRNYLICAQAEADTGIPPHEPWKSLQPAPEEVTTHAPSGDGSKMQPARRAFDRR